MSQTIIIIISPAARNAVISYPKQNYKTYIAIMTYQKGTKMITDHLGNKFNTIDDMCNYHNMHKSTYAHRIKTGMTLEQALTIPAKKLKKIVNI